MIYIDVIVPTFNEAAVIRDCLDSLGAAVVELNRQERNSVQVRITVTDGGSVDGTQRISKETSTKQCPIEVIEQPQDGKRGRGAVLRRAAKVKDPERSEDFFVFLHADCTVSRRFFIDLLQYIRKHSEVCCGFCRMSFGRTTMDFKSLQFMASFDSPLTSFGDQSIIVKKSTYRDVGGMPDQPLCEDVEFFSRCRRAGWTPRCFPMTISVSPRKFDERGVWTYMMQCCVVCTMYHAGVDSKTLLRLYSNPNFLLGFNKALAGFMIAVLSLILTCIYFNL